MDRQAVTTHTIINGNTEIIGHIGVPTHSFKAPLIYNPWFADQGLDLVVVPMGCEPQDFSSFLPLLFRLHNTRGALITMPHKKRVLDLLDEVSTTAQICGACNAVKRDENGRLIGDMFDGQGFVRSLLAKGRDIAGASALVVGCGGVGSAIAASLAEAGLARLALYDAQEQASQELTHRISQAYPSLALDIDSNDPLGFDIVVNATPLGMMPSDPLPLDPKRLSPGSFVGEVVMSQTETAFLAAARAAGCQVQVGTDMLFEQIPAYLEFFDLPSTTPGTLRRLAQLTD